MLKVILVILVVAVALYFALRLLERKPKAAPGPESRRTIAPDDDIDFLRDIDRRQRRRDEPPHPEDS